MKIGIDLDGIVCDVVPSIKKVLADLGYKLPFSYVNHDWGWTDSGLPSDALDKAWDCIVKTPNFWESVPPMDDVKPMYYFWRQYKDIYDIYFITSRPETVGRTVRQQSVNWLSKHFNGINSNIDVLAVEGAHQKAEVLEALNINYFIDDFTKTIVTCMAKFPKCKSYLRNQPWNAADHIHGIKRVNNITEFFNEVERYDK